MEPTATFVLACLLTQISSPAPRASALFSHLPLAFIENRGQVDERAHFLTCRRGLRAYFTEEGFILQLFRQEPMDSSRALMGKRTTDADMPPEDECITGANLFL